MYQGLTARERRLIFLSRFELPVGALYNCTGGSCARSFDTNFGWFSDILLHHAHSPPPPTAHSLPPPLPSPRTSSPSLFSLNSSSVSSESKQSLAKLLSTSTGYSYFVLPTHRPTLTGETVTETETATETEIVTETVRETVTVLDGVCVIRSVPRLPACSFSQQSLRPRSFVVYRRYPVTLSIEHRGLQLGVLVSVSSFRFPPVERASSTAVSGVKEAVMALGTRC